MPHTVRRRTWPATLWLNGNLPAQLGDDPEEITRIVAAHLDPPRRDPA
jgi:hypothetical protein